MGAASEGSVLNQHREHHLSHTCFNAPLLRLIDLLKSIKLVLIIKGFNPRRFSTDFITCHGGHTPSEGVNDLPGPGYDLQES